MSIRPLSKALQEKAENELNETANKIKDIEHIREWAVKQPHLTARTDDQWLLAFLRGSKFSLQQAKAKLDTFYTVRKLMPEFFSNRDPFEPAIQEALKLGTFAILPTAVGSCEPRVIMKRLQNMDPSRVSVATLTKLYLMALDILLLEDDNFNIAGVYAFTDFGNVSYKYATQLTLDYAKKISMCLKNAYPVRSKQIMYLNAPLFYVAFYNIINLVAKQKQRTIFVDENNKQEIYKMIPRLILPQEYGGDGPSFDQLAADFKTKIESYREWFLQDEVNCTDETKRIDKSIIVGDMFGIDGSFRKLDID